MNFLPQCGQVTLESGPEGILSRNSAIRSAAPAPPCFSTVPCFLAQNCCFLENACVQNLRKSWIIKFSIPTYGSDGFVVFSAIAFCFSCRSSNALNSVRLSWAPLSSWLRACWNARFSASAWLCVFSGSFLKTASFKFQNYLFYDDRFNE